MQLFMRNVFNFKKCDWRKRKDHILTRVISIYIETEFYDRDNFGAHLIYCVPIVIEAYRGLVDCQKPT